MPSFGNTVENDLQKLLYNATAIANVADNAATSPLTNVYVSLHTANPGEAGDQTTSEATYGAYARVAVARTSGGWTVTNNQVVNAGAISFPEATSGSNIVTHFATGQASSGAGKVWHYGQLTDGYFAFTAATSDTFTMPGRTVVNDDKIMFYTILGATLPTGITEGTEYFVIGQSGDTFQVSTSQGGAAVDITASGAGIGGKKVSRTITTGITPQFAASALVALLN